MSQIVKVTGTQNQTALFTQSLQSTQSNVTQTQRNSDHYKKEQKIKQLRRWMIQKGCIIHPGVEIPSFINGYQGVASKQLLPPRTLILAIPSSLILTVSKCYKQPQLHKIFQGNDNLFDFYSSQDAQFNILCVFLMYHKLNIQQSPWKIYLQTIGQPQTAIDWSHKMLIGLNKSTIQQILHVQLECQKLQDELCQVLKRTDVFGRHELGQLKECFGYCYRAVMTRCFGYNFGQSSLIPVADLINHGCETVDHQLINTKYQKELQFNQSYKEKSQKIDCTLLGIKRGNYIKHPFRQRFLVQNNIVPDDVQTLSHLNRKEMDRLIGQLNQRKLRQQKHASIKDLDFCQQNDLEDNDTDQQEETARGKELERLKTQQLEQIENFKKYFSQVRVETYKQVEDRYERYERQLTGGNDQQVEDSQGLSSSLKQSKNDLFINGCTLNREAAQQAHKQQKEGQQEPKSPDLTQQHDQPQQTQHKPEQGQHQQPLFFTRPKQLVSQQGKNASNLPPSLPQQKGTVPIQYIQQSQSQSSQQQDDQQWGLQKQSYFTMATSSAVPANRELFNSYGSRTNKFLLIWYGFCYRNNLHDSVSLRLHVKFPTFSTSTAPEAKELVLDTYVGGQGRSFRKNASQQVNPNQVSKQFRLKRNAICSNLIIFLRLYLLEYYKGKDLYKLCVTIPSSLQFEMFVLGYYRQIVSQLYERYPLDGIRQLQKQLDSSQLDQQDKQKIRFKLIFLQQQISILDDQKDTIQALILVIQRLKSHPSQKLIKSDYSFLAIHQLRKLKDYLVGLQNCMEYIVYQPVEKK